MEIFGEQHSSLKSTHHRRSRVRRSMQFVRTIHALLSFNHSCSCRSTDCTALGTLYALKGTMRDLDSHAARATAYFYSQNASMSLYYIVDAGPFHVGRLCHCCRTIVSCHFWCSVHHRCRFREPINWIMIICSVNIRQYFSRITSFVIDERNEPNIYMKNTHIGIAFNQFFDFNSVRNS